MSLPYTRPTQNSTERVDKLTFSCYFFSVHVASQMQAVAAAATGQPLLAPAPVQHFVPYAQPHPQHFQSQPYPPMVS